MTKFTFSIDPWSLRRYSVAAENIDDARHILWESLSQRQRDNVDYIECVSKQTCLSSSKDREKKEAE